MPRARRSSGGQTTLLTALKDESFFTAKRTISDIRAELAKKGHTFKSNEISPSLVALTRDQVLKREKNGEGQWIYFAE